MYCYWINQIFYKFLNIVSNYYFYTDTKLYNIEQYITEKGEQKADNVYKIQIFEWTSLLSRKQNLSCRSNSSKPNCFVADIEEFLDKGRE